MVWMIVKVSSSAWTNVPESVSEMAPVRFIIKVGYACNNRCLFCHASHDQCLPALTTEQITKRIHQARQLGATSILFSGGEPTIRKDLVQLATVCQHNRLSFGLITNGRMLSYLPLLKQLLARGLDYVYISLHGPQAVHEQITRAPGSFAQTYSALRLLQAAPGIDVTANAVVINQNLRFLGHLVDLLAPLTRVGIKFTCVEPKGGAGDDPAQLPDPALAAQAVAQALTQGKKKGLDMSRFGVDGFPHCLDSRFSSLQDDLFTHNILALRETDEDDFYPIDYGNMSKPAICRRCLIGDGCKGTWTNTIKQFGSDWLHPVHGAIANSYNYFPVDDETTIGDRRRALRLRTKDAQQWFSTDTADFAPEDIVLIRDQSQQIYLQLDDAPMVTDFPLQLRKLAQVQDSGSGVPAFSAMSDDVFTAAELRVRRILSGLEGRILDVGCGQTRYHDLLLSKLNEGSISYVGVDPRPGDEIRSLAGTGRVELYESGIEEQAFTDREFDWALILRSHNHLADLWTAYSRIMGVLRWGGHLLVVDNVAFGLVRPTISRSLIDSLPKGSGLEHLRNHSDADAGAFLGRFPLLEVERHPLGPRTANQWVILYRKLWPGGQKGVDSYRERQPESEAL
jgi:pyruvate-formate lyase-activating enzyme/SAM-dependent methyltransferase